MFARAKARDVRNMIGGQAKDKELEPSA